MPGFTMTAFDRELIRVEEVYQKITEDPKWNRKVVGLTKALMKFVESNDPHHKCFGESYGLNYLNNSESYVRSSSDRVRVGSASEYLDAESSSLMAYREKSKSYHISG